MTRQQIIKLVWSEWFNSTSSASTVSWKFVSLPVRKLTVSLFRSSPRFSTSSTSSFFRSSFARDLQRFYAQIASLFPVSSIFSSISSTISPTRSSARDARDLHRKLMQRLSVSSSRFSSRTYLSHDSSRDSSCSSSRYSSARNSRRTLTRNASFSSSRSSARILFRDSSILSLSILSPRDSSARTLSSDSSRSSSHDSFIKSCLFIKNLYIMFHRLSEKEHASQSQRQRVFLELTYSISFFISVSSLRFLKRFLQRSKTKLSFWIR